MMRVPPWHYRSCVFRHVCWNLAAPGFQLTYHSDPAAVQTPLLYKYREAQAVYNFSAVDGRGVGIVGLTRQGYGGNTEPVRPVQSWQPLPPEARRISSPVVLGSASFWSNANLGHILWEEVFPPFQALIRHGVYTHSARLLRVHGCHALTLPKTRELCSKFASAVVPAVFGGGLDDVASLRDRLTRQHPHGRARHACFDTLVAGGAWTAFDFEMLNTGKEPALALFRARVLRYHGLPASLVPTKHLILLNMKGSDALTPSPHSLARRSITNLPSLLAGLKARVSHRATVEPIFWASMTMREQFELATRATIVITEGGGGSMHLVFCPTGAHLIFIETRVKNSGCPSGCSMPLDFEWWTHVRHLRVLWYQVEDKDERAQQRKYGRDEGVNVDVQAMSRLVEGALDDMEPPN